MSLFQPSRGNAGSTADSYQSPPWGDAPPWNVGGTAGDTVIVAPPYNASEAELAELVDKLTRAIERTLTGG